jgi:molybdate transport repressor ModE-like protein
MTVRFTVRLASGPEALDASLIPLLRAIGAAGSLNQAVATLRLSYRHAWGLLGKAGGVLGQPLVVLERGRGARLSPLGQKLVDAEAAAHRILDRELAGTTQSLNRELAASRRRASTRALTLHASHDLALAALRDLLAGSKDIALELRFRGSLECLADLAQGHCDLAGFHVPDIRGASAAYGRALKLRSPALIRFVTRRQGLIVAAGNPRNVRSLADLATGGVRFINRQPGSGTRLCFDQLLAAARIRPQKIHGYQVEEFTHAAVAATVASGMADAGFGIEAAARQQGLDFVPLATERYYLAARAGTLARTDVQALLTAIRGPAFRRRVLSLAGYGASGVGETVALREALRPAGGDSG